MTIERVGSPDPISKPNKADRPVRPDRGGSADSVSVSVGAKEKAEIYQAIEAAKASPDIRMDKIEEIKKKLEDPNYISNTVMQELADRLMEYFNLT
jgi:negative regulator of flagellin synthesis FlgM